MNKEEIEKILLHELENVRAGREAWAGLQCRVMYHHREPSEWKDLHHAAPFTSSYEYRIKPRTVYVNGVEVPAGEKEALPKGTVYYIPAPSFIDHFYAHAWNDESDDCSLLEQGLVYRCIEDAIARAKAMLLTQSEPAKDDGWIENDGKITQISDREIEVKFISGGTGCGKFKDFNWSHRGKSGDIARWRFCNRV